MPASLRRLPGASTRSIQDNHPESEAGTGLGYSRGTERASSLYGEDMVVTMMLRAILTPMEESNIASG